MKDSALPTVNYHDLSSLNGLRSLGLRDEKTALKAAAQQFEATFLNMLLKSMREANAVFQDEDGMDGGDVAFYQGMHDEQLAATLSQKGGLGLADLMVQQLTRAAGDELRGLQRPGTHNLLAPAAATLPLPHDTWNVLPLNWQTLESMPVVTPQFIPQMTPLPATPAPAPALQHKDASIGPPTEQKKTTALSARNDGNTPAALEFVQSILPHARRAATVLGVDEKVLIAQAALETGWGKSLPANGNNCFGIKSDARWQGQSVNRRTLEVEKGMPVSRFASFRAYQDLGESFDDYVRFVQQAPRYEQAQLAQNAHQYVQGLAEGGYATDPQYANKVMAIYQRADLQQWIAECDAAVAVR